MDLTKINLGYSLKNIPIPSSNDYMKCLLEKVESFIRRIRWKAFFYDHPDASGSDTNYNFRSERCPPQHDSLIPFENDLYEMMRSIKFRNTLNKFQSQLSRDVIDITSSNSLLVPADKTTNLYKVSPPYYNKLLLDNITASYQKTDDDAIKDINLEARLIASKLNLDDKIEALPQRNAFITLKDHKPTFPNNPKCRLINPSKSEIGKVSKIILDKINTHIRSTSLLNQWRNTSSVLSWFSQIPNKTNCKFIKFDIVNFYPSISESLLLNAIRFAKGMCTISDEEIDTILHARKSLLFCNGETWIKKGNQLFDVTMGSFDGAEVCELVGLFLLHHMQTLFDANCVGLYRDDGLAILRNKSGPASDKIRKNLIKLFQDHGLQITVELNLIQTDYLDTTLNLKTGQHWPYRKPNDQPLYIHCNSNHPPAIKKQIPAMINDRLSRLSSTDKEFQQAAPLYSNALHSSGYNTNLTYNTMSANNNRKRNRKRNIIWFNPPYSEHVETNIGREFLKLVDKHFPPHHKLRKICNRNNLKVSYSCMPNMAAVISRHNKKVLLSSEAHTPPPTQLPCNCKNKNACPLNGDCRKKAIIYRASLSSGNTTKFYFGSCSTDFKSRYYNHVQSFTHSSKRNATELSKEFWRFKDRGVIPSIKWSVVCSASPYKCGGKRCNLCLAEKLTILRGDKRFMLNKRSEILGKCRHTNKYKLKNVNLE